MIGPDLIFLCIFCAQMDLSLEDSECPTANGEKEKERQQNIPAVWSGSLDKLAALEE